MDTVGAMIRRLRLQKGLTQDQLGAGASIDRAFVSHIELGRRRPSIGTLGALQRALGLTGQERDALVRVALAEATAPAAEEPPPAPAPAPRRARRRGGRAKEVPCS